jgi:hypothetical protein
VSRIVLDGSGNFVIGTDCNARTNKITLYIRTSVKYKVRVNVCQPPPLYIFLKKELLH